MIESIGQNAMDDAKIRIGGTTSMWIRATAKLPPP
jgi:hypothetical protein